MTKKVVSRLTDQKGEIISESGDDVVVRWDKDGKRTTVKKSQLIVLNSSFQNGAARAEAELGQKMQNAGVRVENGESFEAIMKDYAAWAKAKGHMTKSSSSVLRDFVKERGYPETTYRLMAARLGF